jgi:tetratricopeptide (TPR) repeat protein
MRFITAIALLVVCAYATEQSPEVHNERGAELHRRGKYAEAEVEHRAAVATYEARGDTKSEGYAAAASNLAATLQALGKEAESRTILTRVLALEPILADSLVIAQASNNLAILSHSERDFGRAISLLRRAITNKSVLAEMRSGMLHNLGAIYFESGQFRKARESFEQSMRDFPPKPASLNYLARLAARDRDHARAQWLLEQALEMQRKALGDTHPFVGVALSDIGELQRDRKMYAAAAESFERALSILQDSDGIHAASVFYHFGELRRMEGRDAEALQLYERAIGILTRACGPRHVRLAVIYKRAAQTTRRKTQAKEYTQLADVIERSRPDYTRHTVDASAFVKTK